MSEVGVAIRLPSAATAPTREPWWQRLLASRSGAVGAALTGAVLLAALAALAGLVPHDPIVQHPADRLLSPSWTYLLGTDQFGRDTLARCMAGAAASLQVSLLAVGLATVVGTTIGVIAGWYGGWIDLVAMRLTDVFFAFPAILLALTVVAALGRGWFNVAIAIAIVYTPIFVRMARAPVLSLREAQYVLAGRLLGFSVPRLLLRHVLPNISSIVIVQITLALSWAILTESSLSFLGLGQPPPAPSLGQMVSEAKSLAVVAPWTLFAPALVIVIAVVGLNLLGDGLRDALDPTQER
ncbi:MAG TPA: ABC transporter permease [Candidatus Dormibacteraeota bacterium]